MSDSIFDDKPVPVSPTLSPRAGVLVISAFLLGSYTGNLVPAPYNFILMGAGLVGMVYYLTSQVVIHRKFVKEGQERTHRTESRLEKHVGSQSTISIPVVDVNALQNRTPTP